MKMTEKIPEGKDADSIIGNIVEDAFADAETAPGDLPTAAAPPSAA